MIKTFSLIVPATCCDEQIEWTRKRVDLIAWRGICKHCEIPGRESATKMAEFTNKIHVCAFWLPHKSCDYEIEISLKVIVALRDFDDAKPGDLVMGHSSEKSAKYTHPLGKAPHVLGYKEFRAKTIELAELQENGEIVHRVLNNYWICT